MVVQVLSFLESFMVAAVEVLGGQVTVLDRVEVVWGV
jgi:hypothetical protein